MSENRENKTEKKNLKIRAALLAVYAAAFVIFNGLFYSNIDTARNQPITNFSNSITADSPTDVYITASSGNLQYIEMSFVPNSREAENTTITLLLCAGGGTTVREKRINYPQVEDGRPVRLDVLQEVKKGDKLTLKISTDAQREERAYRATMGIKEKSDVDYWTYSGYTDYENVPGMKIVYHRFGLKTFALFALFALRAALCAALPRGKFFEKARPFVSRAIYAAAPLLLLYFIELNSFGSIFDKSPRKILCNYLVIFALQLFFTALAGAGHRAVTLTRIAAMAAGTANHFTMLFRGSGITPQDILVVGTAMDVAGNYKYAVDIPVLLTAAAVLCITVFAVKFRSTCERKPAEKIALRGASLAACIAVTAFVCGEKSARFSKASLNLFRQSISAKENGTLYNFAQNFRYMKVVPPENYDSFDPSPLYESYKGEKGTGQKPDIIVIMNETLTDLSSFVNLPTENDAMEFIHSLRADDDPNTFVGGVVVPAYGANTCNSEFEAETGMSMYNFGVSCIPYRQYIDRPLPGLAQHFKALGYGVTAMHPGAQDAYNRDKVFIHMGFDKSIFAKDFHNADIVAGLVSDRACYDEILKILDREDSPQCVFNITIQNHGGYSHGYKNEDLKFISEDKVPSAVKTYLSLIRTSDQSFEYLISRLQERGEPTLVIMFGDHHPALTRQELEYLGMDKVEAGDSLDKYTTPFIVWANYDIEADFIPRRFSSNYIMPITARLSGGGTSGYENYLLNLLDTAPVYSIRGVYDRRGSPLTEEIDRYKCLQYAIMTEYRGMEEEFFAPAGGR